MKKILLLMIVLLVSGAIQAQESKVKMDKKSFLTFHAGPSFPLGDFGSTNLMSSTDVIANRDAGFAKTGYNLSLNYGYQLHENYGLTASAFYNNNRLNTAAVEKELDVSGAGLKLDHWQWYGLTVGPMVSYKFNPTLTGDFKVMAGVANANTPKVTLLNETLISEDWSTAVIFQTGLDMRINIGNSAFLFANADYLYMRPNFKVESPLNNNEGTTMVTETVQQKISVLNLSGGVGIRF